MFVLDLSKLVDLGVFIIILLFLLLAYIITIIKKYISDKKFKNKMKKNTEIAIEIINQFEQLLEKHNIKIPSESRKNNESEACIYGIEYYELEDSIIEILNKKNN